MLNMGKRKTVLTAWPDHGDHWVMPCHFTEEKPGPRGGLTGV